MQRALIDATAALVFGLTPSSYGAQPQVAQKQV
jgi:hypothetical protein